MKNMDIPNLFFDATIKDDVCWFVHAFYPALFAYDLRTEELKLKKVLPIPWGEGTASYGPIKTFKNKLVIAPRCSTWILIYDMETETVEQIEIDLECIEKDGISNLFTTMCIEENYAYLIPGRYPAIIKINLFSYEITYINGWYKEVAKHLSDRARVIFGSLTKKDNKLFLPCWQSGDYMVFSLEDNEYELVHIQDNGGMSSITFYDNHMLCSFRDKSIIWGMQEEIPEKYENNLGIGKIVCDQDSLYIIPVKGHSIQKYDFTSRKWTKIIELKDSFDGIAKEVQWFDCNFLGYTMGEDYKLYLPSSYDGNIIILDLETGKADVRHLQISEQDKQILLADRYKNSILESTFNSLDRFIEEVSDGRE